MEMVISGDCSVLHVRCLGVIYEDCLQLGNW